MQESLTHAVFLHTDSSQCPTCLQDKGISQNDACVPLTVRVEVMDSPVSRQRRNMEVTENKENLNVTKCIRKYVRVTFVFF